MIVGIGIDLCEISRMEQLLQDGRFLALAKALGVGLSGGDIAGICVLHDKFGAPYYDLRGDFAHLAGQRNIHTLHLSITHENGMAAAVAIAEREKT